MKTLTDRPTYWAVYPPSRFGDEADQDLNVEPEVICPVAPVVGVRFGRAVALHPDGRIRSTRGALVVCRPRWDPETSQIDAVTDPLIAAHYMQQEQS